MKNLVLSIVFIFGSFTLVNANSDVVKEDICFDKAIEFVQDMESELGITFNNQDTTDMLNDSYMLCWCLSHIDFCLDNW